MAMRSALTLGCWTALLAASMAACTVDRTANKDYKPCTVNADCEANAECYNGYCVGLGTAMPPEDAAMPDATPGMDATMDAAPDASNEDAAMPCSQDGGTIYCYSGPEGTDTVGECRPGTRTCEMGVYGPCIGEIVPQAEECNHDDDDCDDITDEDLVLATCETGLEGVCGEGMLVCDRGRSMCEQVGVQSSEICDGKDNDCNGETDEGEVASAQCYVDGAGGCALEDGEYKCVGVCKAGVSLCEGGVMLDCDGAVAPTDEVCGPQGTNTTAADEDCDGQTDEMCECEDDGDTQPCYTGPAGTLGVGECEDGEQECNDREWGTCLDVQLPVAETCANIGQDNDCDGQDFIPGGKVCVDAEMLGRCAFGVEQCVEGELTCVLNEARDEQCDSRDDDCDGKIDEAFDLQTDNANCGQCGNSCDSGDQCCNGLCIETATDERNCGSCGTECGSGLTCCNSGCVNLVDSEQHCGACGRSCASGTMCCPGGQCKSVLCLL